MTALRAVISAQARHACRRFTVSICWVTLLHATRHRAIVEYVNNAREVGQAPAQTVDILNDNGIDFPYSMSARSPRYAGRSIFPPVKKTDHHLGILCNKIDIISIDKDEAKHLKKLIMRSSSSRLSRRSLFLGLGLAISGRALHARADHQGAFRLASWNLKGIPEIDEVRAGMIARVIATMSPDVMILTELRPQSVAKCILQTLGREYRLLVHTDDKLAIGTLVKTQLLYGRLGLIPGTQRGVLFPRSATSVRVNIEGNCLDIIGVHLLPLRNRFLNRVRSDQLNAIGKHCRTTGLPSIVIGDFNIDSNDEQSAKEFKTLEDYGFNVATKFRGLAGSYIENGKAERLLDGIATNVLFGQYFSLSQLSVFRADCSVVMGLSDFAARISDHLPVVAELYLL